MKTKTLFLFLFAAFILFTGSCNTDFPDNGTPGNGGTVDRRLKFLGTWNVSDQPARLNYVVTIEKHPLYEDKVNLKNFADLGGRAVGLVVGNTIVVDEQVIVGDYKVEGTGSYINASKMNFDFFIDDGIDKVLRKAVFTK